MTGCIVGWAHTPFGKHESEDVELLIVRVARDARRRCRVSSPPTSTRSCSATSTAASSKQEFTSLAGAAGRRTPCASSRRPGSRTPAPPARPRSTPGITPIAAGEARFVLVVGVEKMTDAARRRDRQNPAQGVLPQGGGRRSRAASPASSARSPQLYFQRYGDQSDALAAIAAKNHKNGVANPLAQLRKDLGFEFCRTRVRQEPARRRAAASAPIARWSRTAPRPWC